MFCICKICFSTAECMHMAPCLISKALVLHLVTQSVWNRHSQGQLCPAGNRARSCFSWIRWRPSITYYLRILFTNLKLMNQMNLNTLSNVINFTNKLAISVLVEDWWTTTIGKTDKIDEIVETEQGNEQLVLFKRCWHIYRSFIFLHSQKCKTVSLGCVGQLITQIYSDIVTEVICSKSINNKIIWGRQNICIL